MIKSNAKKSRSKLFQTTSRDISFLRTNPEQFTKTASGFEFLTAAKDAGFQGQLFSSLPSTIDEVRVLNSKNSFPALPVGLLETLEAMQTPVFDRDLQREAHKRTPEFNVDNCKFGLLLKAKNSRSRNEVQRLAQWLREWSAVLGSRDINSKTLGELRDVIAYCSLEFKHHLEESCSTRALLFTQIWMNLTHMFQRVQDKVSSFLSALDEMHLNHVIELQKKFNLESAYEQRKLESAEKHLKYREDHINELSQMIRQLSIKLGNSQYAIKQFREDLRATEEKYDIVLKENEAISEFVKSVKQATGKSL